MQHYLAALHPILTETQLDHASSLVQSFVEDPGPSIQDALIQRRSRMDNWAYDWWLDDMYLNPQLCLPINVSPGLIYAPWHFNNDSDIAQSAASLITAISQYKDKLDRRALPVERATSREKGQPLCMSQFYRLFTSYRIPGSEKDFIRNTEPERPSPDQHIIIACKNQFYRLQLKSKENPELISEAEIASNIMSILNTPASNLTAPLGILTTQNRKLWAENREILLQDSQNQLNLNAIETSLIILCLDTVPLPVNFNRRSGGPKGAQGFNIGQRDETNILHQALHGGGSCYNSCNRWFDKTLQFIIGSDGAFGVCIEHSPMDGIAVVQMIEELFKSLKQYVGGDDNNCRTATGEIEPIFSSHVTPLQWNIQSNLNKYIREAAQSMDNIIEDLDYYVYRFDGYGKDFIKKCAVSPDVYVQLALQLAYHKLYGRLTATYESASTRRFLHGRVDCIRASSTEALSWAAAMNQISTDNNDGVEQQEKEKLELFDAAVKKQTDIMIQNILGEGIDIHLLGLREQCKLSTGKMHPLFTDESYRIANHFKLSTSQVPSATNMVLGYGPVVPDGYGCCYNPWPKSITFGISAFHSSESTKASLFAQAVQDSLTAMQELLQKRIQ
ncbi:choline acetyltransferase [Lycorma delicatula]|uniref:choline acetyltransferase n=1 Tax=Lycorma delicatula TaxID=130591 RepID=UPI003F50EBF9